MWVQKTIERIIGCDSREEFLVPVGMESGSGPKSHPGMLLTKTIHTSTRDRTLDVRPIATEFLD
jgi:hypothetical protein